MSAAWIALRPARGEDAGLLFEWANEPHTRSMSFSSAPIGWEDHCAWLARKLADERCRLFVVTDGGGRPLGQVRLDLEPAGVAVISLSIEPGARGRGIGRRAIALVAAEAARQGAVAELHAYVRPDNVASIAAFLASGFRAPIPVDYRGARALHLVRKLHEPSA